MKARTIILTTSAIVALVAPAAHAAGTSNRLYQTQAQTVLYEKSHQTVAKSHAKVSTAKKGTAAKSTAKKGAAKKGTVAVHKPLRPAPPIIPSAVTILLDGTYNSPSECIEAGTEMVSDGSAPVAEPPATTSGGGNEGSGDTPPVGDPDPSNGQGSNGQGELP